MSPDDKTMPLPPVSVAVIGGTGDGGSPMVSGLTIKTPDHQPDLIVRVVTPLMAITVRFINFYLTSLLGLIPAALTPKGAQVMNAVGAKDFFQVVLACASIALAPALLDLGKNLITIFTRLEKAYPLMTGNI